MALYTQKAILRAFGEMLEEMPFDKITVTALVKRCDISSNTFYYHSRMTALVDVCQSVPSPVKRDRKSVV